jgi:hypothetical protein
MIHVFPQLRRYKTRDKDHHFEFFYSYFQHEEQEMLLPFLPVILNFFPNKIYHHFCYIFTSCLNSSSTTHKTKVYTCADFLMMHAMQFIFTLPTTLPPYTHWSSSIVPLLHSANMTSLLNCILSQSMAFLLRLSISLTSVTS